MQRKTILSINYMEFSFKHTQTQKEVIQVLEKRM